MPANHTKRKVEAEPGDGWSPQYLKKTLGRETIQASRKGSMYKKYGYNKETKEIEEIT